MNSNFDTYHFIIHAIKENKNFINEKFKNLNLSNVEVVSNDNIKSEILSSSIFAVSKSGTISLEICNAKIPSIIIYKMNFLNYLIVKFLVRIKYANIINIINDKEIIPELIQGECNAKEIYNSVVYLLNNPEMMKQQINYCERTLKQIRSKTSSSEESVKILSHYL